MRISGLLTNLNLRNDRIHLSLLLGAIFGLSVYAYWLIDIFPPLSRRILLFTALAGAAGMAGYFFLLEFWLVPRLSQLRKAERWKAAAWGIVVGLFLMFAGTSAWMSPARYLVFLLPRESLEMSVSPVGTDPENDLSMVWFKTSLGDVSYDTISHQGWERTDAGLVLRDTSNNSFRWSGRTGEGVSMVFHVPPGREWEINLSWNGRSETVGLSPQAGREQTYHRRFEIPFYASRTMALFLVSINFMLAGCVLYLLAWKEKDAAADFIKRSIHDLSSFAHSATDGGETKDRTKALPDSLIVAVLLLLTLLLRIFRLENLYPYTDEYHHLLAAKAVLNGASWDSVYQRSFFLVTLPVVLSFRLFGVELWAARLPGVLFNTLAVIPLFLITKKINRHVAVLSCLLYAASPYIIAFARDVREYAHYPFYYYWVVLALLAFLQGVPEGFVLAGDWKKIRPVTFLLSILLVLPFFYGGEMDSGSTFQLIWVAYGVFAIFLLQKFDLRNAGNLVLLGAGAVGIGLLAYPYISRFLTIRFFDARPLWFFFGNPEQQWYFDRAAVLPLAGFIFGFFLFARLRRLNFVPLFLYALFIVYLLFFVLFFGATGFNMHPRFLVSAQIWFIPATAMGLYCIWAYLRILLNRNPTVLVVLSALIFLAAFNPSQVMLPTLIREEYMPVSQLIHDDFDEAHPYLLGRVRGEDVLIGGVYARYASWRGIPKFSTIYTYSDPDIRRSGMEPREFIASIVRQNDSGWIVLDDLRFTLTGSPLPLESLSLQGKEVEYVGRFLNQYVWRWGVK